MFLIKKKKRRREDDEVLLHSVLGFNACSVVEAKYTVKQPPPPPGHILLLSFLIDDDDLLLLFHLLIIEDGFSRIDMLRMDTVVINQYVEESHIH